MSVGLVVVSHSAKVAEGVVELASQMAGDVRIQAAGGTDDGGIGTDATLIAEAIGAADEGDGVLVLVDLGSAVLSAQLAIDELVDEAIRGRVRIAEAPWSRAQWSPPSRPAPAPASRRSTGPPGTRPPWSR